MNTNTTSRPCSGAILFWSPTGPTAEATHILLIHGCPQVLAHKKQLVHSGDITVSYSVEEDMFRFLVRACMM